MTDIANAIRFLAACLVRCMAMKLYPSAYADGLLTKTESEWKIK